MNEGKYCVSQCQLNNRNQRFDTGINDLSEITQHRHGIVKLIVRRFSPRIRRASWDHVTASSLRSLRSGRARCRERHSRGKVDNFGIVTRSLIGRTSLRTDPWKHTELDREWTRKSIQVNGMDE